MSRTNQTINPRHPRLDRDLSRIKQVVEGTLWRLPTDRIDPPA